MTREEAMLVRRLVLIGNRKEREAALEAYDRWQGETVDGLTHRVIELNNKLVQECDRNDSLRSDLETLRSVSATNLDLAQQKVLRLERALAHGKTPKELAQALVASATSQHEKPDRFILIRDLREITGLGLSESKELIDDALAALRVQIPNLGILA